MPVSSAFQPLMIDEVGADAALEDIFLAVELLDLLAFGDLRSEAGLGVETRDPGAAGAHPLGERPLRRELDLELAGEELPLELLVLADIGRDHLLDLPRSQQLAEPLIVDAGIVRGDREVLDAVCDDRVDQPLGDSAQAEAAGRDGHAVEQQPFERALRVGIDFLHAPPIRNAAAPVKNGWCEDPRLGRRLRRILDRRPALRVAGQRNRSEPCRSPTEGETPSGTVSSSTN